MQIKSKVALFWFLVLVLFLPSCTFFRRSQVKNETKSVLLGGKLDEARRQDISAASDILHDSPSRTNAHEALALEFVDMAQQLDGLPIERIDVKELLAANKEAYKILQKRKEMEVGLVREKNDVDRELAATKDSLIAMGQKYEAERNKSIVSRVWHWSLGIFGIGGLIALLVFFPVLIPIFGKLISMVVGAFPSVASVVGVVGKKAFDQVVSGVEAGKKEYLAERAKSLVQGTTSPNAVDILHGSISAITDEDTRRLVRARKAVLNV